jgi:hypothetical protein
MLKLITNAEYSRLKDLEGVVERLRKDMWADLDFTQQAELLLRIGKGSQSIGCRAEDAATIKAIGVKWMEDICSAYGYVYRE